MPVWDRPGADAIAAINAAGLDPTGIGSRTPTLDDVYLRLTGDRLGEAA